MTTLNLRQTALQIFKDVLSLSRKHAKTSGAASINPSHVLRALMSHGPALRMISEKGYDPFVLMHTLSDRMPERPALVEKPYPEKAFASALKSAKLLVESIDYDAGDAKPNETVFQVLLDAVLRHADQDPDCSYALSIMTLQCAEEDREDEEEKDGLESMSSEELLEEDLSSLCDMSAWEATTGFLKSSSDSDQKRKDQANPKTGEGDDKDLEEELKSAAEKRPKAAPSSQLARDAAEVEAAIGRAFRDLTDEASKGLIDPVIGRSDEIERVLSAVQRRRKRSVILHGPSGVGKTAIAEGIALALRSADAPRQLAEKKVYELSMSALVAGARYRGDFEERMEKALARVSKEKAIIFIDEIHNLMGLGSSHGRGMDAPNILKPALARGDIVIIGATTTEELPALYQDRAILRRFELIEISEPSHEDMMEILDRAGIHYLEFHGVDATSDVYRGIIDICAAYMTQTCFPDKAFDVLDRACVEALRNGTETVTIDHVRTAALQAGAILPVKPSRRQIDHARKCLQRIRLSKYLPEDITPLEESLSISLLAPALRQGAPGWVLAGGRESCKAVIQDMCLALQRRETSFPASRLREASSGDWLTGSSYARGTGALCESLESSPENILVFEDIQDAHISVLNVIHQLIEKGSVKSGSGRSISARRAILVFTTRKPEVSMMGFGKHVSEDVSPELKDLLTRPGVIRIDLSEPQPSRVETESEHGKIEDCLKFLDLDDLLSKVRGQDSEEIPDSGISSGKPAGHRIRGGKTG